MLLDIEKYKDLTLRINYNKWPSGTKCTMSQKGNITTYVGGDLLFYRTTLERNPDLLNIFFDVNQLKIFTRKEINFIKAIIDLFKLPDNAYIDIEDVNVGLTGDYRTYLYVYRGGFVLLRYDLSGTDMFKDEKILNKCVDIKEFKNATIVV